MASLRTTLARLKKLLLARDADTIEQGVELTAAIADPEVYGRLLEGVTVSPPAPSRRGDSWHDAACVVRVEESKIFQGNSKSRPFHRVAALALIASAPSEVAVAAELRGRITVLELGGHRHPLLKLDLRWLLGLDSLVELKVSGPWSLEGLECLKELPNLRRLSLASYGSLNGRLDLAGSPLVELLLNRLKTDDLSGLAGAEKLRRLEVRDLPLRDLTSLSGLPLSRLALIEMRQLTSLEGIGSLDSLEVLSLTNCRVLTEPAPLPPSVKTLGVRRGSSLRSLRGLGELPALMTFSVFDCGLLTEIGISAPRLKSLKLTAAGALKDFTSLAGLGALEDLEVRGSGIESLEGLQRLTELRCLDLNGGTYTDLTPLSGCPRLSSLSVLRNQELCDLSPLAACAELTEVVISETGVEDLGVLGTLPKLTRVHAARNYLLRRLEGVPRLSTWERPVGSYRSKQRLRSLGLVGFTYLESLEGIGAAKDCEYLDLAGCTALKSLEGIQGLLGLKIVDLRRCTTLRDVSALAGLPELKVVAMADTPVAKNEFPESVQWTLTADQDPDFSRRLKRKKPKPKKKKAKKSGSNKTAAKKKTREGKLPVPQALAELWDDVERGFRVRDLASVDAACDLAQASGAPELYQALLEGVSWDVASRASAGLRQLKPNKRFRDRSYQGQIIKQHALRRLVGEAPEACAAAVALRTAPDSAALLMSLGESPYRRGRRKPRHPADVRPLASWPRLRRLRIERAKALLHPEVLGRLEALRVLELDSIDGVEDLAFLRGSPLTRLALSLRELQSLRGVDGLEELVDLDCRGTWGFRVSDTSALRGHPSLRRVALGTCDPNIASVASTWSGVEDMTLSAAGSASQAVVDVGALAALERLALQSFPQATGWSGVEGLRFVSLHGVQMPVLDGFATLPLEGLWVYGPKLERLGTLPRSLVHLGLARSPAVPSLREQDLPKLRFLDLSNQVGRTDLDDLPDLPALEGIDLDACHDLVDISGLERCPNLRKVRLTRCGKLVELAPLDRLEHLEEADAYRTQASAARFPRYVGKKTTMERPVQAYEEATT